MNETQLIKTIKAHIAKGDHAKEKADQHYISAGLHLKELKDRHDGTWAEWEELLKTKIGIGKSRASELMQIADGRKTVEDVREDTNQRKLQHRKRPPFQNGEHAEQSGNDIDPEEAAENAHEAGMVKGAQGVLQTEGSHANGMGH